jgi:2-dehydropantoate 2-reductase
MKVCIVGAGAIGGFIGTKLAVAGEANLCTLARGKTLDALQQQGWRLETLDKTGLPKFLQASARASSNAAELGVQDVVVIAVKGPALSALAATLRPLIGPHTLIVPAMNGVPWWFCKEVPDFADVTLESVDPGGAISAALPLGQIVGCVVHTSTSMPEPGLVTHKFGQGLILGEPFGRGDVNKTERVQRVVDLLARAGFDASQSACVRYDIWYKLWGNLTMNPVSAMTGATIDLILGDALVKDFCSAAMQEAASIGRRIGCDVTQSPDDRHLVTAKLGAFKTSMLQDAEAGRPLELDGIVSVVREMGKHLALATPNIDALLGLTRLFAQTHGLYPLPSIRG